MKPSVALKNYREGIRAIIRRSKTTNPRVFGSAVTGDDTEGSELEILVDAPPGITLFDLGEIQDNLETFLGIRVGLRLPSEIPEKWRDNVLAEAQPL